MRDVTNVTLVAKTSVTLTVPLALLPMQKTAAYLLQEARGAVVARAVESGLAAVGAAWGASLSPTSVLGTFWQREVTTTWWWLLRDAVTVSCEAAACQVNMPLAMQLEALGDPAPMDGASPASGVVRKLSTIQRKVLTAHMLFCILGERNATVTAHTRKLQGTAAPDSAMTVAAGSVAQLDPSAILAAPFSGKCTSSGLKADAVPSWCYGSDSEVSVAGSGGQINSWTNPQTAGVVAGLETQSAQQQIELAETPSSEPVNTSLSTGAIVGVGIAGLVIAVALFVLVRHQRRNRELQGELQAATAKVQPSSGGGKRPPSVPTALKSAPNEDDEATADPPATGIVEGGSSKSELTRDALPVVERDVSTSSMRSEQSEHTVVPMSPEGPQHKLLSMPFDLHSGSSRAGPAALPFSLHDERRRSHTAASGAMALPFDVRSSRGSSVSERSRPSVEAMNMGPDELPFPVDDAFDTQPRTSLGKEKRTSEFRRLNEFGVQLPSETAGSLFGTSAAGSTAPSRGGASTLRTTQRYSRFPTRSVVASQRGSLDENTMRVAERLGLRDVEVDYSSDSSGADAYVDGQSSQGRRSSVREEEFGQVSELHTAAESAPAHKASAAAALPEGVHVSMRYQQRKQQQAAFNAAIGGASIADTDSTTNLSTEVWHVSNASEIMQTHGRTSPFAPNLSGGEADEAPQLSLGMGAAGIGAASRLTMSSGSSSFGANRSINDGIGAASLQEEDNVRNTHDGTEQRPSQQPPFNASLFAPF